MTTETTTTPAPSSDKPKRTRKAGDYRFQQLFDDGLWADSAVSYKGPAEALDAAQKTVETGQIIRIVRVASPEYSLEATTTTVLKKRPVKK